MPGNDAGNAYALRLVHFFLQSGHSLPPDLAAWHNDFLLGMARGLADPRDKKKDGVLREAKLVGAKRGRRARSPAETLLAMQLAYEVHYARRLDGLSCEKAFEMVANRRNMAVDRLAANGKRAQYVFGTQSLRVTAEQVRWAWKHRHKIGHDFPK